MATAEPFIQARMACLDGRLPNASAKAACWLKLSLSAAATASSAVVPLWPGHIAKIAYPLANAKLRVVTLTRRSALFALSSSLLASATSVHLVDWPAGDH